MERSGRRKQQQQQQEAHKQEAHQQQRGAGRIPTTTDVCLTFLDEEGWCFLCGEVRYLPLSQSHAWQEMEEPERPASGGEVLLAQKPTKSLSSGNLGLAGGAWEEC
ncbi:UNVERIFIED_CONTAM: hypothetical protein FKN15_067743 [Acipenser sinensis]